MAMQLLTPGLPDFVIQNIPAPVLAHLTTHSSTYWKLYKTYISIQETILQWLYPLYIRVRESPDMTTMLLLGVILFLSVQILGMLSRVVMFWIRLGFRIIFFGGLAVVGVWIYHRGIDGAAHDFGEIVGWVSGTWSGEYNYWKEQEKAARSARQDTFGRKSGRWS